MTATPLIFDFHASFRRAWITGGAAAQALKLAGLNPDAMGEQLTAAVHAAAGELAGDVLDITAGLSAGRLARSPDLALSRSQQHFSMRPGWSKNRPP